MVAIHYKYTQLTFNSMSVLSEAQLCFPLYTKCMYDVEDYVIATESPQQARLIVNNFINFIQNFLSRG